MSTLSDLIAEAHEAHIFDKPVAECRCGVEMNRSGHWARERRAHRAHLATVTAAVVADWLDGLADAHNSKIAMIAGVESPRDTSTAHGMRRASAEARKGAGQ